MDEASLSKLLHTRSAFSITRPASCTALTFFYYSFALMRLQVPLLKRSCNHEIFFPYTGVPKQMYFSSSVSKF